MGQGAGQRLHSGVKRIGQAGGHPDRDLPQCRGMRATALLNDEFVPVYCTVNAAIGYHFGNLGGVFHAATLQLYGSNLTDTKYFGEIYSTATTNAKAAAAYTANGAPITGATIGAQSYTGEPGAPLFLGARFSVDIN